MLWASTRRKPGSVRSCLVSEYCKLLGHSQCPAGVDISAAAAIGWAGLEPLLFCPHWSIKMETCLLALAQFPQSFP